MIVVWSYIFLIVLHIGTVPVSFQELHQQKPQLRKTYHYELIHPKLPESITKSIIHRSNPVDVSTEFSPTFLPPPKLRPQAPLLVPDILNNLFQQGPVLKEIGPLFIPNTINEPAVTSGQLENFEKDLEEQAMEQEKEQNDIVNKFENTELFDRKEPKLFVNVNGGLYKYNYTI